ncbi:MAG: hypothetical protein ACK4K0_06900, partial [Flavobacteriales bacterium]
MPIISGDEEVCCLDNTYTYCVNNPNNFTSINWSFSQTGATIVSSAGGCVEVQFVSGVPGVVTANVTDVNGCESQTSFQVNQCCQNDLVLNAADFVTDVCNPTYLSTLTQQQNISNLTILLNNDFIIDQNVTIDNTIFYVRGGYKIQVQNGRTVTSINSVYREYYDNMWQGIELEADSRWSGRFDTYRQAIVAADVKTGAQYNFNTCKFESNYIGIQVQPHTLPSTTAQKSVISTQFYTADPLLPPYAGQNGFTGIQLNSVNGIQIGLAWNSKNEFYNLRHGINTRNSSFTVYGNHFHDLVEEATGINAFGNNLLLPGTIPQATIGQLSNNNLRNEFDNMKKGVVA